MVAGRKRLETRIGSWFPFSTLTSFSADLADRLYRLQGGAGELVLLILDRSDGLVGLDRSLFLLAGQCGGHLADGAKARRIEDDAIARLDDGAAVDRVVMDDGVFQLQGP